MKFTKNARNRAIIHVMKCDQLRKIVLRISVSVDVAVRKAKHLMIIIIVSRSNRVHLNLDLNVEVKPWIVDQEPIRLKLIGIH